MEYCKGRIFVDPNLPSLTSIERTQVFSELCKVLAKLHCVDFKKNGLENYGKPGFTFIIFFVLMFIYICQYSNICFTDVNFKQNYYYFVFIYSILAGYMKRNLERFIQQYKLSYVGEFSLMEQLINWLIKNVPDGTESWVRHSIVHGDFRLVVCNFLY